MRRILLVSVLVAGAAGCTDDNPLPDIYTPLANRVTSLEAQMTAPPEVSAQQLAAEAEARKRGDADGIASAKTYADGAAAKVQTAVDAESTRAKAAEDMLTTKLGSVTEPRMIGPNGEDLGRWLGPSLVYIEKAGGVLDLTRVPISAVGNSAADCKGKFYTGLSPTPAGTLAPSEMGTIWITGGPSVGYNAYSVRDKDGCRNVNIGATAGTPISDTGLPNVKLSVEQVHLELRPAAR